MNAGTNEPTKRLGSRDDRFAKTFGEIRIRDIDHSLNKLGEITGIDHSTLSRYENGSRHPSYANLCELTTKITLSPDNVAKLFIAAGYIPPHWLPVFDMYGTTIIALINKMVDLAGKPGILPLLTKLRKLTK